MLALILPGLGKARKLINERKLEINRKRKTGKLTSMKIKQHTLEQPLDQMGNKKKILKISQDKLK